MSWHLREPRGAHKPVQSCCGLAPGRRCQGTWQHVGQVWEGEAHLSGEASGGGGGRWQGWGSQHAISSRLCGFLPSHLGSSHSLLPSVIPMLSTGLCSRPSKIPTG